MLEEKIPIRKIIKFTSIITLNKFNWKKEMSGDISLKAKKKVVNFGFVANGKSPNKMSEIVYYDKIVLKT